MAQTLTVTVNADGSHGITVPERFESEGDFAVEFRSEGPPAHVHLRFDDALAEVASVDEPNHFVPAEGSHAIPVSVRRGDGDPVSGHLAVVTGYGAEETTVPIRVTPESEVPVDEDLAKPAAATEQSPDVGTPDSVPLVALGLGLALVGVAVAVAVDDAVAPLLGVAAVVVGVGVAAYIWR